MKLQSKLAAGLAVMAIAAVPSVAGAAGPDYAPDHPPQTHQPKGHAYGWYCKGKSKKHVQGEKGTEFSRCVHTLKQADNNDLSPRQACKTESKKHVKGEKGTDFSRCVKAVAQMHEDKAQEEAETQA